jgi:hypothetical protein
MFTARTARADVCLVTLTLTVEIAALSGTTLMSRLECFVKDERPFGFRSYLYRRCSAFRDEHNDIVPEPASEFCLHCPSRTGWRLPPRSRRRRPARINPRRFSVCEPFIIDW